jgi:N-acylneuraminate cytidylyltransferase
MILGVTPARGGSKGVPDKNLRALAGRPLLAWTVEAALDASLIDRYVVSTEDARIARVARECGAEVLERPAELAGDEVLSMPVVQHALECLPADIVVLLQATSPIRDAGLIDRCVRRVLETGVDSLATGYVCQAAEYGPLARRRQDIDGFFVDDGNVYVVQADVIRSGRWCGARPERLIVSREENIDIDDAFDFWMAEQVLARRTAAS